MTIFEKTMTSPLGQLRLLADDRGLRGIYYQDHKNVPDLVTTPGPGHQVLVETQRQLDEFFAGRRRTFELPLALHGTPFMLEVWNALSKIPYGAQIYYGELAKQLGKPRASRAVGRANGLNPVSIVLPCHRVVGSNGKLTGYAGGLSNKDWLLKHEQSVALQGMALH